MSEETSDTPGSEPQRAPLEPMDSQIRDIQPGENKETYNLIVADFHTYFVGEAKILNHDNTDRAPTNSVVPGLAE